MYLILTFKNNLYFKILLTKKPTVGLAFAAIKIYNRDPLRDMAEPVHNSVTAMATGNLKILRQLRVYPRNGPKLVVGKLISTNVVLREGDGLVWVVDVISEPDLSF